MKNVCSTKIMKKIAKHNHGLELIAAIMLNNQWTTYWLMIILEMIFFFVAVEM